MLYQILPSSPGGAAADCSVKPLEAECEIAAGISSGPGGLFW